jgi:hypothetical protein
VTIGLLSSLLYRLLVTINCNESAAIGVFVFMKTCTLFARKTRPFGPPLKKIGIALIIANSWARAGTITIQIPADVHVEKAIATTEKEPKANLTGSIDHDSITFADPTPGLAYEAKLTLKDGTILRGVDMNWYSRVPDKANAQALTDDDRQQMTAVFSAGAQFFNVQECTLLKGNHNRAVMLVRCERNSKFHSDKGDEIIWRPELWYFQNEHGGWEKVLQTDRVMERERFATQAEYHAVVDKWKWVPELGGLKVTPKTPDLKVTLPPNAGVAAISAAVPPSTQPAVAPRP